MSREEDLSRKSPTRVSPEEILALLQKPEYKPLSAPEIAGELKLKGRGRKEIEKVLHRMVREGRIVLIRKNRYSLGAPADLISARLEVRRSGDGFLAKEEGRVDVRIPKDNLATALPGDLVTVRPGLLCPGHGRGQNRRPGCDSIHGLGKPPCQPRSGDH